MAFSALTRKYNGFLPQFLTVLSATLNAVSDGMNYGWSSPMIPRLKKDQYPVKITDNDGEYLESTLLIAGLVGLPLTTYLVNKIGRKQSTLAAAVTDVIGWILIGIADDVIYLYIARFLMGIAADIAFISSPMYISEISHKSIRGYMSGTIYVMSYAGVVIIYAIGPSVAFYVPTIIAEVLLLTQICTLPFMPDSPYFLIMKGQTENARKSLKRLRGTDDVDSELNDIKQAIEEQKRQKKPKISDIFTVPSIRKALIIMTILNGGQHLAGYTAISMNVHSILSAANSTLLDEQVTVVLFGSLMLIGSIVAVSLVDIFGRKTLLLFSTITTTMTHIALGVYFYMQTDYDMSSFNWIPLVALMSFALTFKFGLGIVPIVLTAELFPPEVKSYGMAYADAMYVIFGTISVTIYNYLNNDGATMYYPFLLFAGCCCVTALFVSLFIPETKGKTLEEVQQILKK